MKSSLVIALLLLAAILPAQEDHHSKVDHRGDHVMGFSHEKTTHHFRLFSNGGAIEVTANDQKDTASRDQIRMHLSHIAGMFSNGNFKAPMLIHDQVPPGVPTLERLKAQISYRYEDIDGGGRVRIVSKDKEALEAAHEFLKFQIADHRTGDTLEVSKVPEATEKP